MKLLGINKLMESPFVELPFNHPPLFRRDSLLFCKAKEQECQALVSMLNRYEEASGQKINTDKSSVFFSPNTPQELRESILNILGPMQDSRYSKYLGLPSIIGK